MIMLLRGREYTIGSSKQKNKSTKQLYSALTLLLFAPTAYSTPLLPPYAAIHHAHFDTTSTTTIQTNEALLASTSNITTGPTQTTATPTLPYDSHNDLKRRQQGTWSYYTSVFVTEESQTLTSVGSIFIGAGAVQTCTPDYSANQQPCGPICCQSGYYCANQVTGVCLSDGGNGGTTTAIGGGQGTVGVRPTTISGTVVTLTVSPTVTTSFGTAVSTQTAIGGGGSGGTVTKHKGLSGGAIAGIVIGVLLGIFLLSLLCFCCCLDWLLHCFGLRHRRSRAGSRRTTVVQDDEYIRRTNNGRWYGSAAEEDRYSRRSKRKTGAGLLGALGAGAATAGLFSMFRKREDKRVRKENESYTTYSDYSYYTYGSGSGDSRDNRTRRSSRTRQSSRTRRTGASRSRR